MIRFSQVSQISQTGLRMEITTAEAGAALGISRETIRLHVAEGRLPARKQGIRGILKIQVDDLREFARQFGYVVNDQYLTRLASKTS